MSYRLFAFAAFAALISCGSPMTIPAGGADAPGPDAAVATLDVDAAAPLERIADAGTTADTGSVAVEDDPGEVDAPEPSTAAESGPASDAPDVHPLLELYREKVGAWMTGRERRRIERIELAGTGRADGVSLAELIRERILRELIPAIFGRVGSKQLREDARLLRKGSSDRADDYREQASSDLLANYTLVDFESAECYESDLHGKRRSEEYSRRCRIAFGAARLLTKPLGEDLRWPEFGSFGNCRGEPGYDPQDEMPCFTSGSEGGSLNVLFDLALEIGVPRRRVAAFAAGTFERLVREAAEQTRVAQIEFAPIGSRRLSTMVHDVERWMTAAEWQQFDAATGLGSGGGLTQRAEDELLRGFARRVLAPLWRKSGTKKGRRLAETLTLELVDDAELLPFSRIWNRVDEEELLDTGEYLQCQQRPEIRFTRCVAATEATSSFLALTDYWGADDDGDPASPYEGFDGLTGALLDDLLTAGVPRKKLIRELTSLFKRALESKK